MEKDFAIQLKILLIKKKSSTHAQKLHLQKTKFQPFKKKQKHKTYHLTYKIVTKYVIIWKINQEERTRIKNTIRQMV
jgi:hypothetical protein